MNSQKHVIVINELKNFYMLRHIIHSIKVPDDMESIKERYYNDYWKSDTDKFIMCQNMDEVNTVLSYICPGGKLEEVVKMTKKIEITVDIKIARVMLQIAGYKNLDEKSDDEIFDLAISMCSEYGVTVDV